MYYPRHVQKFGVRLRPYLHPDFFFVNIGANDGVLNDPIHPFVRRYGWRGIAVEPVPHVFAQLQANYRDVPGVVLEQVAISDTPLPFWYVQPGSGSAEFAVQQLGSLHRDRLDDALRRLRFAPSTGPGYVGDAAPEAARDHDTGAPLVAEDVGSYVCSVDVECVSFNALMERHDVDHIDFLNIDTEGSDFDVLRSVDLTRYCPRVLCIEVTALSPAERTELDELLDAHGFRFLQHLGVHSHVYARDP